RHRRGHRRPVLPDALPPATHRPTPPRPRQTRGSAMTTGRCATCGAPITVTTRHPTKRYCSPRCRVADWHRHHDRPQQSTMDATSDDVPARVPDVREHHDLPDRVPAHDVPPHGVPPTYATNGDQRCPHCHKPIAIIAVLVPPTAAHVRTPEV